MVLSCTFLRYGDLLAKNCQFLLHFPYPSHSAPSFPMFPLEFHAEVNRQETRVMGLSSSEDCKIVAGVVLAWYRTVTDGRTDGQTESIIAKTALCIASYADALSKMIPFMNHEPTLHYRDCHWLLILTWDMLSVKIVLIVLSSV